MAGLSPSRKKRNDFTDFFRSSTSSAPSQKELSAPLSESEQDASGGYLSPPEGSKTIKRVATKLPFLGRSRKKSSHSAKSGTISDATSTSHDTHETTDFGESSSAALKKSRRFSQPASSPENASPSQAAPSHPFFPIKLAAHFHHVKSKKPAKGSSKHDDGRAMLSVPPEQRPVSFESDISDSSAFRSTTPRPNPTITLSPSPSDLDNFDEFDDLFTRPKNKNRVSPKPDNSTPASAYRDMFHNGDSSVTLTPARRNTTGLVLSPAETISDIARREARELADRTSNTKLPGTASSLSTQLDIGDLADESAKNSPTIEATPPSAAVVNRTRSLSPASVRAARLRTKSAATTKLASKPPNIPLPLPPPPKTKPPALPVTTPTAIDKLLPLSPSRVPTSNSGSPGRRRAHTDSSLPPSLLKREAAIRSASKCSTPDSDKKSSPRSSADKENLDVDSLTPEQMKEALLKRVKRVEELEDLIAEMTKAHSMEKAALEKRVRVLETDVHKRNNENRALVRILGYRVDRSKCSETDTASILPSRSALSSPDDSGAESYATSGAESSLQGSTSVRKKAQRPLILSDALYRSSPPSKVLIKSELPHKRESFYSITSTSATSSASSLPPSSPSLAGSPLTAILESPSATNDKSGAMKKRTTPNLAGESLSDDDRRLPRISRFSTSSSASSSSLSTTAATSAYSANLRRGRPPSIAQVLDKGKVVDEAFEKIHIAGTTTAIAIPYP